MDTSELNWSEQIWMDINGDALKEVGKVRVAQKVFPTSTLENDPTQIANEVIDFASMTVKEGSTKPFVEIFREFSLTSNQGASKGQARIVDSAGKDERTSTVLSVMNNSGLTTVWRKSEIGTTKIDLCSALPRN